MAIAYDSVSTGSGATTTATWSHTTSGSDRILFVCAFQYITNTHPTSVTYNGVAMTYIGTAQKNNYYIDVYYLINPASGANNVVITYPGSGTITGQAVSYTGAKQSGQPDGSAVLSQALSTSITQSHSVTESNCWGFAFTQGNNITVANLTTSGVINTLRGGVNDSIGFADSNGVIGTGSQSMGFGYSISQLGAIVNVSFSPATTPANNGAGFMMM